MDAFLQSRIFNNVNQFQRLHMGITALTLFICQIPVYFCLAGLWVTGGKGGSGAMKISRAVALERSEKG